MSENISSLSGRKGLDNNLFDELVKSAKDSGTPSPEQLKSLAHDFLLGTAVTHGAASFYDFLKPEHHGKKVHVCNGSACLLAGTQENVKEKLAQHFKPEEVGHMCCLGRCHENSSFNLGENNYSGRDIEAIGKIIEEDSNFHRNDEYKVYSLCNNPVLTGRKMKIGDFAISFRQVLNQGVDWALQQIKQANIRGRGGAGFPMGFKLESCKDTLSDQKYIVCNADEGDPGAYSDRYLLEQQPLSVLFGMMVAGYIIGANRGVLYIRGEYPESIKIINKAISELELAGLHGKDILASDFNFRFKVIEGAGAYICGEETALLASIEGQRPEVRVRPPYPTQEGLFLKPTVVNNVETLAAIPWIITQGGEKYAGLGTKKSTGTKLVCLDSFVTNPGMYEVEMGSSFQELIFNHGGGFVEPIKAVHVGGPLGGVVPTSKIPELTIDFESFDGAGFLMGHAGVVSIPESYPMIKYLEHLFEFTADESCGKCFPCSIGSVRGKEMMSNAHQNAIKINRNLLDDLLETMEVGSLCALGGGLPLGVKNILEYFEDELKAYIK